MSAEKAKEFLETILKEMESNKDFTEKAANLKTEEQKFEFIAELAEQMGYPEVSAADIKEAISAEDAKRKARTDADSKGMEELDDSELEGVAGGYYYIGTGKNQINNEKGKRYYNRCRYDFTATSCVEMDACNSVSVLYWECEGKYHGLSEDSCILEYSCKYARMSNG
jgi:Mg-chelatase subunit ChlI